MLLVSQSASLPLWATQTLGTRVALSQVAPAEATARLFHPRFSCLHMGA